MLPDGSAGDEVLAGQVYYNDSLAHDEQRMAELNGYFKGHSDELSRPGVTRQLFWQEYLQLLSTSSSVKQIIFPSR